MDDKTQGEWYNFASTVIYLREKNGLSKEEMAGRLGIGVKTLEKIESGILPNRLSSGILIEIFRNFGISPADQLRGKYIKSNN